VLTFEHQLAKIRFNVWREEDSNISIDPMTATLSKLPTLASVALNDAALTANAASIIDFELGLTPPPLNQLIL
jgi:hypothetical protein